ncbi:hypothetical protein BT93_H2540 [Corymbia citriodora subsp. variegata]|nr:hypothetical protein BT93_H2540 [Corymbia citriodora subsp. variegata]
MMQDSDRISQLPGHVADKILSLLPIKEAVRTSILSRQWRYQWSSLPHLMFNDQCTSTNAPGRLSQDLVKIVDEVLLLHTGPIKVFVLNHTGFRVTRDIDRWILHLSRVSIKQIGLLIYQGQNYKIPTSLFNCQNLTALKLYGCSVKIPSSFEGFKKLYYLYLQSVELSSGLDVLISRCPLLQRLNLRDLQGITRVNVETACKLRSLDIGGTFLDVAFGDANCLESVTVDFGPGSGNANLSNLHKFFKNMHKIQILNVKNYSLKYLALGNVPHTLPHALLHLKDLSICMDFTSKEEILTVMCLMRSSPQLKKLEFENRPNNRQTTRTGTMADFWQDHHSFCLEQVQVVSLHNFRGTEPESEFIKFLLTGLPNLEKMRILGVTSAEEKDKLFKELLPFCRVLEQASDHSLTRRSGTQPTRIRSHCIESLCNCFTMLRGT